MYYTMMNTVQLDSTLTILIRIRKLYYQGEEIVGVTSAPTFLAT